MDSDNYYLATVVQFLKAFYNLKATKCVPKEIAILHTQRLYNRIFITFQHSTKTRQIFRVENRPKIQNEKNGKRG